MLVFEYSTVLGVHRTRCQSPAQTLPQVAAAVAAKGLRHRAPGGPLSHDGLSLGVPGVWGAHLAEETKGGSSPWAEGWTARRLNPGNQGGVRMPSTPDGTRREPPKAAARAPAPAPLGLVHGVRSVQASSSLSIVFPPTFFQVKLFFFW